MALAARPAGIGLIYLAALNGLMASSAMTCTMGDASGLWLGVISIALYALGIGALALAPPGPRLPVAASLVPALILIAIQTWFSGRLLVDCIFLHKAACDVITGDGPYPLDGDEGAFTLLWVSMSVGVWAGLSLAWRRARPPR